MCNLSMDHHMGGLCSTDSKLEGSYVGFIPIQLAPVGMFIGTGLPHMAKAPTVQTLLLQDSLLVFL
jgi:hypothetical protein